MTEGRRHVDDASRTLGQHHAKLMLQAQECAENVGVEGGSVAFGRLLRYRARLAFGTGGIDGDIQATKPRDSLIDQATHIVFVANIGPNKFSFRSKFAELANQLLALFLVSPGNDNACALVREGQRSGATNTCQRASNQNNLVLHKTNLSILIVVFVLVPTSTPERLHTECHVQFS